MKRKTTKQRSSKLRRLDIAIELDKRRNAEPKFNEMGNLDCPHCGYEMELNPRVSGSCVSLQWTCYNDDCDEAVNGRFGYIKDVTPDELSPLVWPHEQEGIDET